MAGTGTFGRVYLVRHKSTGKFFAMKILKKTLVVRLKQQQHVEDERAVLMAIDFPFVVALFVSSSSLCNENRKRRRLDEDLMKT